TPHQVFEREICNATRLELLIGIARTGPALHQAIAHRQCRGVIDVALATSGLPSPQGQVIVPQQILLDRTGIHPQPGIVVGEILVWAHSKDSCAWLSTGATPASRTTVERPSIG